MNQRTAYLLQVLENIGSPLMASILQAPGRGAADETAKDAQRMAELLARTTQASIEMSRSMDFGATPEQGDSLRVALAALASDLVGAQYRSTGKAPGENDLKKITAAMQTVLTFSENFMPGTDAAMRLENLNAKGQEVDAAQAGLQYIHAFIPVVNAVTAFPFGQPEQKLIMDVASRVIAKAADLRKNLFGDTPDAKRIELALVTALAKIYGACHEAETTRLMSLTEDQRAMAGLGPESIWKSYDLRVEILAALAKSLVPEGTGGGYVSGGSSKGQSGPAAQAPVQTQQAPPQAPPPAEPPKANPLAMFAKTPPAAPPAQPPAAPPAASPPPVPPPADTPPAPPSEGSPMSFFKPPGGKN